MAKKKSLSVIEQEIAANEERLNALRTQKKKIEAERREALRKEVQKRHIKIGELIESSAGGEVDMGKLAAYLHVRKSELAELRKGEQ